MDLHHPTRNGSEQAAELEGGSEEMLQNYGLLVRHWNGGCGLVLSWSHPLPVVDVFFIIILIVF